MNNFHSQIDTVQKIVCEDTGKPKFDWAADTDRYYGFLSLIVPILAANFALYLIIALVVLYHKYKYEIKVFMYAHKIFRRFVIEEEIDRDAEYDAFISYCYKDENFVVKHLVPALENGPHSYKLNLSDRYFPGSGAMVRQMIRSIESSRRTICVFSRNYLANPACKSEFEIACTKDLQDGRKRVIIILLEDLSSDKNVIGPKPNAYITLQKYVKWGDSQFWNKLRYALPHY